MKKRNIIISEEQCCLFREIENINKESFREDILDFLFNLFNEEKMPQLNSTLNFIFIDLSKFLELLLQQGIILNGENNTHHLPEEFEEVVLKIDNLYESITNPNLNEMTGCSAIGGFVSPFFTNKVFTRKIK